MTSATTIEACFDTLVACAVAGERCPISGTRGVAIELTTALARTGRIRVEIYGKNFRVVEILTGPHAGKRTKAPPNPSWKPYRLIDRQDRWVTREAAREPKPSAPRPLSRAELEQL